MNLKFREAIRADLPEIVKMLADEFLYAMLKDDWKSLSKI